ncbi:ATP-binding protein [Nisaea sp.]|uniref:AAA family ATPase n=1 Tax=Nisaea sp. TaxID=2024842 RepID=UPI0032EC8157
MSTILHLFCGKIAAGKSTFAKRLSEHSGALLISEDAWLGSLFGPEMRTVEDYVAYSARLRAVMGPHVSALLEGGVSVVLDYPANTRGVRRWMRGIADSSGACPILHYLELPDDTCRMRLNRRNAEGGHEFAPSDEQFDLVTRYFDAPQEDEGLPILVHGGL